ncbi:sensor histidine kinase [Rhodovibrio salinarum]|nr:ATP-binding protein [Rhodovibrio salinarum]
MRACNQQAGVRILFLLLVCTLVGYLTERTAYDHSQQTLREATQDAVTELRVEIERTLSNQSGRLRALAAYVRSKPDVNQTEFAEFAADLATESQTFTRNIALAKGLVVTHVYPIEPNKRAIGLDLRQHAQQWPGVAQTVQTNKVTLAGPLDLVQGGQGIIARIPIRLPDSPFQENRLWGLASIVLDVEAFLAHLDLAKYQDQLALTLSTAGSSDQGRTTFFRTGPVVDEPAVVTTAQLANATWILRAAPRSGWPTLSKYFAEIVIATALFFLVGLALICATLRYEVALIRLARENEQARQAAETASQSKSVFLANMSHELRTPLNAVLGYTEIMQKNMFGPLGDERYTRYVDDIHRSGLYLLDLLTDVLDLSRIEAGGRPLETACVPLSQVLEDVLTISRHAHSAITFDPADDLFVAADVRALKQVLINVTGNAIKHGNGAAIRITATHIDTHKAAIRVEDDGPGIPAEALPHVMEPFFTGAENQWTAKNRRHGTGIGLALSQRLVAAMEGRLSITSQQGKGTTVTIELPTCDGPDCTNTEVDPWPSNNAAVAI